MIKHQLWDSETKRFEEALEQHVLRSIWNYKCGLEALLGTSHTLNALERLADRLPPLPPTSGFLGQEVRDVAGTPTCTEKLRF